MPGDRLNNVLQLTGDEYVCPLWQSAWFEWHIGISRRS